MGTRMEQTLSERLEDQVIGRDVIGLRFKAMGPGENLSECLPKAQCVGHWVQVGTSTLDRSAVLNSLRLTPSLS